MFAHRYVTDITCKLLGRILLRGQILPISITQDYQPAEVEVDYLAMSNPPHCCFPVDCRIESRDLLDGGDVFYITANTPSVMNPLC